MHLCNGNVDGRKWTGRKRGKTFTTTTDALNLLDRKRTYGRADSQTDLRGLTHQRIGLGVSMHRIATTHTDGHANRHTGVPMYWIARFYTSNRKHTYRQTIN